MCGALNASYWMRLGIYKLTRNNENEGGTAETPRIGNMKYQCDRAGCQMKPNESLEAEVSCSDVVLGGVQYSVARYASMPNLHATNTMPDIFSATYLIYFHLYKVTGCLTSLS